jgi:hypothetical protein
MEVDLDFSAPRPFFHPLSNMIPFDTVDEGFSQASPEDQAETALIEHSTDGIYRDCTRRCLPPQGRSHRAH